MGLSNRIEWPDEFPRQGKAVKHRRGRAAVTGATTVARRVTKATESTQHSRPDALSSAWRTPNGPRDTPTHRAGMAAKNSGRLTRHTRSRKTFLGVAHIRCRRESDGEEGLTVHPSRFPRRAPVGALVTVLMGSFPPSPATAETPFAATVVSYAPGIGAAAGYTNPMAALGSPERMTGDGFAPQAVTPFQPAFLPGEIVSLGMGGSLVLAFDHDVLDEPDNPFGLDLIVFGNSFCADAQAPNGVVGSMYAEGGTISVSPDGLTWTTVVGLAADGPLPTLGFRDVTPYATRPGRVLTDFTRPVDPAWNVEVLIGASWEAINSAYDGSGGGAAIDIGALGLASIRFVRVEGNSAFGFSPEIDAVADVAPLPRLADLNGDGVVGAADLAVLLGSWGGPGPGDLDANGVVDASDLAILLGSWS